MQQSFFRVMQLFAIFACCASMVATAPIKYHRNSLAVPIQEGNSVIERRASDLPSSLFPISHVLKSWTTYPSAQGVLQLSDATLRPHHKSSHPYSYTKAPDGKLALKAHYPKGSYKPSASPQGGVSFYAPGPASVDLSTAKEATFGYSVYFPEGFDFVKGGKLPGLYGGNDDNVAISCSGGRRDPACFSVRLMWRPNGAGELYTYLPEDEANRKLCSMPNSDCNPTYGTSISRGSFHFAPGEWTTVSQRVKLNTAGEANGELELFVGGESVIRVDGLVIVEKEEGRTRGIQIQSFFGGSSPDWATPRDQDVYFSDFSVGIMSTF